MKNLPRVKGDIFENYELSSMTRFKTGGSAEVFFAPYDIDDLSHFLKKAPKDMPINLIGFGSNLLIRDGMLNGILIRLQNENFADIEILKDGFIKCGAFASSVSISKIAMEKAITGMEFLYGIPGSIAGAILTNAGCFGGEMKDIVVSIDAINKLTGEKKTFELEECGFTYRKSAFTSDWIFLNVLLKGQENIKNIDEILEKMNYIMEQKDATQPTYTKTTGSTFKNPAGDRPAWKLIKEAGCQGMALGGAVVSLQHANFIINENDATSADIEDLAEKVRIMVYERFGIMLEYETKIIGSR